MIAAAGLLAPAASAAPGGSAAQQAQEATRERESLQAERAKAAREVDTLQASEEELSAALATIEADLSVQQAKASAAHQATEDARRQVAELEAAIAAGEQEVADLQAKLTEQAVNGYMRPTGDVDASTFFTGGDIDTAQTRQALAGLVSENRVDIIERLRGTKERLGEQRQLADDARAEAEAQEAAEQAALAEVQAARDAQARVKAELDRRLGEAQSHVDDLAARDGELQQIIQDAEARMRAEAEAARKAQEEAARARAAAASRASAASAASSSSTSGASANSTTGGAAPSPGPANVSGLIWPASGTLSSGFGMRWGRLHAGIDISCPVGTPVWAALSGTVIFTGFNGGYGNMVVIEHGDGFATAYAHLSSIGVSEGASVSQGQVIAASGNTGSSTGPHLHFETRVNGTAQNPMLYLG